MRRLAPLAVLTLLILAGCDEDEWSDTPGIELCELISGDCQNICRDGCDDESFQACSGQRSENTFVDERYPGLAARAARVAAQGAMSCEDMLTGVDAFRDG